MNTRIEKEGKKQGSLPISWFSFAAVGTGDKVRVGFSEEFNKALGPYARKIGQEAQRIEHFKGNPTARQQAGIREEDLKEATAKLDKEVRKQTGYSYSGLEYTRHETETSLNSQPDPVGRAKKMGLSSIRETPSGSQFSEGIKPDWDKFFGMFDLELPEKE